MEHTWIKVNYENIPSNVCGIYRLTSPNGKMYIGQAFNIKKRWMRYKNRSCKSQRKLYASLNKYMNFNKWTFEYFECGKDRLNEVETYCIGFYKTIDPYGLNLKGEGTQGKLSQSSIDKMKNKLKGRKLSPEVVEKMKTLWQTPEHIEKMRLAHLGKKHSLEHKNSIGRAHLGQKRTPEAIENMRKAQKGKKFTQEALEKAWAISRNRKLTLEEKARISNSMKGRKISSEAIENMRKAAIKRGVSSQQIEKLRQANLGKKHSLEHIEKIKATKKANRERKLMEQQNV